MPRTKSGELKEMIAIMRWSWVLGLSLSIAIVVSFDTGLVEVSGVSKGATWPMWIAMILFWITLLALTILGFTWRHRDPRTR